jgi:uncharacterized membrane protein YeaQ/YmgE (transglycosylase-associated protein family)
VAARPLGFGPAVVAVFLSRLAGGAIVGLVTAVVPLTARSYSYGSWNRYVFGYSLAAAVVGAFFLPWLVRMFRHEISYAASLISLFAGVIAANLLFSFLSSNTHHPTYVSLPLTSTIGAVCSLVSLLVSAWLVVQSSRRRAARG